MEINLSQLKSTSHPAFQNFVILFEKYLKFYHKNHKKEKIAEFLSSHINTNSSVIFIATISNNLAGFVQLYSSFSSLNLSKTYILNDLYVDELFRKKRGGKKFTSKSKEFCLGK